MKTIKIFMATIALTVVALAGVAQEDDVGHEIFTYVTYYHCPGGPLSRVDEIIAAQNEALAR